MCVFVAVCVLMCVSLRLFQMPLQRIRFHSTSSDGKRQQATAIDSLLAQTSQVVTTLHFKRSHEVFEEEPEGGANEANEASNAFY